MRKFSIAMTQQEDPFSTGDSLTQHAPAGPAQTDRTCACSTTCQEAGMSSGTQSSWMISTGHLGMCCTRKEISFFAAPGLTHSLGVPSLLSLMPPTWTTCPSPDVLDYTRIMLTLPSVSLPCAELPMKNPVLHTDLQRAKHSGPTTLLHSIWKYHRSTTRVHVDVLQNLIVHSCRHQALIIHTMTQRCRSW